MTTLQDLQATESKLLLNTYARYPLQLVRGEGVYVYDEEGHRYLDLLSGIGVSALGYNHPAVTRAITEQAKTLVHTSNLFYHRGATELALRLTEMTGLDRAFFCNSGTEAWEAALKLARAHAGLLRAEAGAAGKPRLGKRFIALDHGFHGRTMGSVATTHKLAYREPFAPVMPEVTFIPHNDVSALRAAFSEEVCGICIEVLQGEGGINWISSDFLHAARELCDSTGALLLLDEIQSGMGRTGRWCAFQHFDVRPDITTLAKPLAGGIPMGAMLCTEAVARAFTPGMHGTTFGGSPFACAVAIAVIDEIKSSRLLDHVADVGAYTYDRLLELQSEYTAIAAVRGGGLMLGIDFHSADLAKALQAECMARHILVNRTHETVIRLLPPYVITREHVDEFLTVFSDLLAEHTGSATSSERSRQVVDTVLSADPDARETLRHA